jgi:general secretion pathway protein B
MSYILDALKKAESERSPRSAPHLHAHQPVFIAPSADVSLRRRPRIWIGLTAAAAALIALAWFKPWQQPTPVAVASAPPQQQPAAKIAEAAAQPAPAADAAPPQPPAVEETPPKPVKHKTGPAKEAAEKKPAQAAAHPEPATTPKGAQAAPAAESRVAELRELPEHIRNEIPALAIGGYLYSGNKADRTVLINKKLLREGDQVAPDLTLEKLTPTGMVLNYKGYRYRASY